MGSANIIAHVVDTYNFQFHDSVWVQETQFISLLQGEHPLVAIKVQAE